MMPKRIAIIGAGASGITAMKECIDGGLTPVCFERTGEIGGLWHYTTEAREGQACVMKSTVINTSKEMMCYSDFPIPADFPNFMHNTKVLEYFWLFVKHFDLEKYIRFHTEILQISKAENFETTGQWVLKVKDKKDESKGVVTEIFDGILVCTGHHAEKNFPKFTGRETFKGKIVHTHDYKDHVGYEDKRVVVIGVGNSGGDVAVELSRIASQVYWSTRRGAWVAIRVEEGGKPWDLVATKRVNELAKWWIAIDLKIWFKGMRTRYGKLTCKKSGDGAKEHTDRDTWILRSFSFLDDHISRVPSRQSCNVYWSTRRGAWIAFRIARNGIPMDVNGNRRISLLIRWLMGPKRFNDEAERRLNNRFDHSLYGLKPNHRFNAQHPTVNDELPNRICCGSIVVKPDIRRLTETGVEFVDGTIEENIDAVVSATGYKFGFPFLDKEVIEVKENVVPLYKYVFPPDLKPCTLAVIGCVQPWGAIMPISELQCRWAVQLFKGEVNLPSSEEMWKDVKAKQDVMFERYVASTRHTIQVDWIPYMDELAENIGAKPELMQLFWSDPRLALQMYFGPCTPYQYRVMGPNKWSGARKAIMETWQRVHKPFETRMVDGKDKKSPGFNYWKLMVLIVVIAVLIKYFFM